MTFEPGQLVDIRMTGFGLALRGIYVRHSEKEGIPNLHWVKVSHAYDVAGLIRSEKFHVGVEYEIHSDHIKPTSLSVLEQLAEQAK